MYFNKYEKFLKNIPNFEDTFSIEYLEFYKRHLFVDEFKDELDNYYSNTNLTIDSIIFKYLNLEFSKFLKEKSEGEKSLVENYFNWKNSKNENNEGICNENFYYKILDFIIIKVIDCLDKCENTNDCCNICLENEVHLKCNKCNLLYHKDCLVKYILNNFKYKDNENGKTFYIINYEISCPQCRKYFLTNFKINTCNDSNSSNKNYKIL
jgi:hypothetical protein